jgi:hypothetical protein
MKRETATKKRQCKWPRSTFVYMGMCVVFESMIGSYCWAEAYMYSLLCFIRASTSFRDEIELHVFHSVAHLLLLLTVCCCLLTVDDYVLLWAVCTTTTTTTWMIPSPPSLAWCTTTYIQYALSSLGATFAFYGFLALRWSAHWFEEILHRSQVRSGCEMGNIHMGQINVSSSLAHVYEYALGILTSISSSSSNSH